ncbi:MAG TPA: tetratricopeptide repeat protein, partial [Ilumatobacteraceae bacterium]|nr:tetratricopeptide repeat protein [Ilumatobacteraceae bacterium]
AIEVGRRSTCDSSGRPVALIELSSLPRGGDVVAAAAAVLAIGDGDLRVAAGPATDMQRIIDTIGNQSMLVIVDNCEHVIADAATLASTLLRHCDNITLLATSREPLAIAGEQVWNLPPLTAEAATELLAARAASAGIQLTLDGTAGAAAQQLVARLDGLPLAIELAAARLRSMTIEDLVQRIDDRYALLSVGPRSAEPRQQTLRGLVDWSHDLLDERERILFRRLAAFSGGATLEAIEHVCADPIDQPGPLRIPATDIDGLISRLVDKSLVTADRTSQGVRFRMLQTMADYSSERLIESGEAETVGARHARYFASRVAPVERGLMGREQAAWIQWLRLEWANITAALDHALAIDDAETSIRLVAPLGWYFFMIDEAVAGSEWLSAALACTGTSDPRLRSLALGSCAFAASTGTDPGTAAIVAERALDTLGSYDDPVTEAIVAGMYVMCQLYRGRLEASRAVLPLMEAAAHRSADRWTLSMARLVTAEVTRLQGEPAEAERDMWRAADGFAAVGDRFCYSICVTHAAELAELRGDYQRAVRMLEESLAMAEDVGFSAQVIAARSRLANLEILRGNLALAASMHRAALDVGPGPIPQWMHSTTLLGLANIARRRGQPDEALRYIDEAMALPRSTGAPVIHTTLLVARGYSADLAGNAEAALVAQREGLQVARQLGAIRVTANAVEGLAGALALAGDARTAATLLGAADALRRRSGGSMPAAERFDVDRAERRAREQLGGGFDAAFAAGASDPEGVIEQASQQAVSS